MPNLVVTARKYSLKYFWYRLRYGKPIDPNAPRLKVDYYRTVSF